MDHVTRISPLLSPASETLYRMGHHDEIVFGDAHFPGESCNDTIIRADGLRIDDLLDAILPLFVLDHVIEKPVMMMGPLPEDKANPTIAADYQNVHDGYAEIVKNTILTPHPLTKSTNTTFTTAPARLLP